VDTTPGNRGALRSSQIARSRARWRSHAPRRPGNPEELRTPGVAADWVQWPAGPGGGGCNAGRGLGAVTWGARMTCIDVFAGDS